MYEVKNMLKKITVFVLVAVMVMGFGFSSAFAIEAGEQRVTMGADLNSEERASVYADFGIEEGSVKELTVTNDEERQYLEGVASEETIGDVALSCIYLTTTEEGSGLGISIKNIKWCTSEMYTNALQTAGIYDANVIISAPHPVTGTAALTGIYKAYEDITGEKLNENAKEVATSELIITGDLAEVLGSDNATELVNELKLILDKTVDMTDDEVRQEIRNIASNLGLSVTDEQVEQLLSLCRELEGLDTDQLLSKLQGITGAMDVLGSVSEAFKSFGNAVAEVFSKVGDFFMSLFGGGN